LTQLHRMSKSHSAITVRVRNGNVSTTDGPFAETKEQLGGYYLIEARDQDDAIRIGSGIPGARFGCVEIRPVAEDIETLEALGLAGRRFGLRGSFWDAIAALNGNFGAIGYLIIGVFVACWLASTLVYRLKRYDTLEIARS